MFRYNINPDAETPIYRQLVDQINAQIRSGALKNGTQLPTVREMAEQLRLSCGTVKHVYDCLQEMGVIEMTRRRGTFVKYARPEPDSRKQQAMNAIDTMVRKLTALQFSPAEIQIFLNLKMREWGLTWSGIRITVVTDMTELTPALEKQLNQLANVKVNICPLHQLQAYPYSVDEQSDVVLASAEDARKVAMLLPDSDKLLRVAFAVDPLCLVDIAALTTRKIGVLCHSEAFMAQAKACLSNRYAEECIRVKDVSDLSGVDGLILTENYLEQCSGDMQEQVKLFRSQKPVVEFRCQLDEGSMLCLEERINQLRDERQMWPGVLRM